MTLSHFSFSNISKREPHKASPEILFFFLVSVTFSAVEASDGLSPSMYQCTKSINSYLLPILGLFGVTGWPAYIGCVDGRLFRSISFSLW